MFMILVFFIILVVGLIIGLNCKREGYKIISMTMLIVGFLGWISSLSFLVGFMSK